MDLALGSPRPDGAPANQAGNVLRRDHVQELGARGNAGLGKVKQQVPRQAQAIVDLVGLIEIGIVDQPLPADCGAGLLKVDPHDDAQFVGKLAMAFLSSPPYSRAASVS